jgi:hypothetical protein
MMMQFAGCWRDMPDDVYAEFIQEIAARRQAAFPGDEPMKPALVDTDILSLFFRGLPQVEAHFVKNGAQPPSSTLRKGIPVHVPNIHVYEYLTLHTNRLQD